MKIVKLETFAGNSIDRVAENAIALAADQETVVEFVFNEVTCRVNSASDPLYVVRDYLNADLLDRKVIGPDYPPAYDEETQSLLTERIKERDERLERQSEQYRQKAEKQQTKVESAIANTELELTDAKGWAKSREKNTDPYGKAALDYAEAWAKLMQIEIANGKTVAECANDTQKDLGYLGITGFMYGCAVSVLSQYWKHGPQLALWHNRKWSRPDLTEGVVNPAVFSIN